MTDKQACAACHALLPWYVAGTATDGKRAIVVRHLTTCGACAQEVAVWREIAVTVQLEGQAVEPTPALAVSWEAFSARLSADAPEHERVALEGPPTRRPMTRRGAHPWRVLAAQARLLHRSVWVASAAAIVLATFCALVFQRTIGAQSVLALAFPVIAAAGVPFLSGSENDPEIELALATPTPRRSVVLSRFVLLLGFDMVLALVGTLALMWLGSASFWALILSWLGPMALLAALSLLACVVIGSAAGAGVAALWVVSAVRIGHGIGLRVPAMVTGQATPVIFTLALLALAGALLAASRRERLPHGASAAANDTSSLASEHAQQETDRMSSISAASRTNVEITRNTPPHRLSALGGVIRYEFAMQIRRVSFWVVFALLAIIPLIQFTHTSNYTHDANLPVTRANIVVVEMAGAAGIFILGVGLLLAGRVRRDKTTRMDEILQTTPVALLTRLLGKYLGCVLATFVPAVPLYLIGIALLAAQWHDASIIPLALAGFVLFVVPATLFVAAFTLACTTVIWPPLYMFLFIGYYLWNSLQPGGPIPTLDGTVLDSSERLVMTGVFHFTPFRTTDIPYYPHADLWLGLANIAALLAAGALALLAAWLWQVWQARHQ